MRTLDDFLITSGYGAETREPFVQLNFNDLAVAKMSPENARDLAVLLLRASDAAYSDAFLVEFVKEKLGGDDSMAGVILLEFRKWRNTEQEW